MSTPREVLAVYTHLVKDYATWRKVFDASAPNGDTVPVQSG